MIELRGVNKSFAGAPALEPTDLQIEVGRTTVLIGPSGCGKSTLLRLIIGLIRSDGGHVSFEGEQLTQANAMQFRRRMGYVIQDGGLFPHLTAEGNAALMARYLGWDERRVSERLHELVRLTRFPEDGLQRYPAQLSGGQKQRVSLMRALMLDPELLLLDEPLGALDPMVRADLQRDLRAIFQDLGKAVVLVTHDIGEAAYFGDDIVLMRAGKIVQQGAFGELMSNPADPFVTQFINAQRRPSLEGDAA
ncbi:MAG: osmoprotectant transport system ATP-binding protein [Candidatus Latescibacterota bacterium]|jgi:osmoprotectant transport system ATP-binding protein